MIHIFNIEEAWQVLDTRIRPAAQFNHGLARHMFLIC